jgi:AcrR family transcriptional regulator
MTVVNTANESVSTRSSRTRRTVLDATAQLLVEGGLGAATIDAIHDLSKVSKTTIYKHWPGRVCVAIDAFAELLDSELGVVDTGSFAGDLRAQLHRVGEFYASPAGATFQQLLAQSSLDPQAGAWMRDRLLTSRHLGVETLWARAVDRAEVRSDIEPDLALDLIFGPIMWRVLRGGTTLTHQGADQVAEVLSTGILFGAPGTQRRPS